MIGQIASTGSSFPVLYDLSLSTANSGSSHRTPDYINILYRTHREGFRAGVVYRTAQTPPRCLSRFQKPLASLQFLYETIMCSREGKDYINLFIDVIQMPTDLEMWTLLVAQYKKYVIRFKSADGEEA